MTQELLQENEKKSYLAVPIKSFSDDLIESFHIEQKATNSSLKEKQVSKKVSDVRKIKPFNPPVSFPFFVKTNSWDFESTLLWINQQLKADLSLADICKKYGITQTSGITKYFTDKAPHNKKYFQRKTKEGYYQYQLLPDFEKSEIHKKVKEHVYPFIILNDEINVTRISTRELVNTSLSLTKKNYDFIQSLCDSKVLTQSTLINLVMARLPFLLKDPKFFNLLISSIESSNESSFE
jgi:hypothetical protein